MGALFTLVAQWKVFFFFTTKVGMSALRSQHLSRRNSDKYEANKSVIIRSFKFGSLRWPCPNFQELRLMKVLTAHTQVQNF